MIIDDLRANKNIVERKYGDISSFNFSAGAFFNKIWDEQTVKARGLYINTKTGKVVARSYDKFFNIGERPETQMDALKIQSSSLYRRMRKKMDFLESWRMTKRLRTSLLLQSQQWIVNMLSGSKTFSIQLRTQNKRGN